MQVNHEQTIQIEALSCTEMSKGTNALKNVAWSTLTCSFVWSNRGTYPPATDNKHLACTTRTRNQKLIVTGDDWGLLNLYRNPNAKGSKPSSYRAHAQRISNLALDLNDKYIYSLGSSDFTMIKWKIV